MAWLDEEHERWVEDALEELRERLIDGMTNTQHTRH
jgi:hypothetical protein